MGMFFGVGDTKPEFAYDYYYGIEWDITVSGKPKRVGRLDLHQTVPLQSKIRRCIQKDSGAVNYYLHANNSALRTTGAAADLTGADGMYMTELPDTYVRFERDGNKCRCLMSEYPLPGFHLWKKDYISAVEATVQRSTLKLASVVNMTEDFRGGNNQADWDELSKSQLGKPATNISLNNFRTYARNRGSSEWNCQLYQTYRKLFWLFAVEYCTFNSQEAFNAELTADGLHQGGLSNGVTNVNFSKWLSFSSGYPIIPCGVTNSLGNHTGVVEYTLPEEFGSGFTVNVPSYRGVENPFGHIFKWTDGCKVLVTSELSSLYVCDNPDDFAGGTIVENYVLRGNIPRSNGYIKQLILGDDGEILPLVVGGSSTTYFCDNYEQSTSAGAKAVAFGGSAYNGAYAGFVFADAADAATTATTNFGSRLCFYPNSQ